MQEINTIEEFLEKKDGDKGLVVLFTANWCPDCIVIKPSLPEIEEEYKDSFNFVSVNRDNLMELCQDLDIFGIPSFVTFQKGKELDRFVSTKRKSPDEIREFLDRSKKMLS